MAEPKRISHPSHRLDELFRHESFESLASSQEVRPATSLEALQGRWPKDQLDDGFEAALLTWRQAAGSEWHERLAQRPTTDLGTSAASLLEEERLGVAPEFEPNEIFSRSDPESRPL